MVRPCAAGYGEGSQAEQHAAHGGEAAEAARLIRDAGEHRPMWIPGSKQALVVIPLRGPATVYS